MADSKRLQILKALTAHFETITVLNGYQFDLAGRVYRGRSTFGSETALPCITILEALNPDRNPFEAGEGIRLKDSWILLVQGWTDDGDGDGAGPNPHPTDDAHNLMADVKKAIGVLMREPTPTQPNPSYMLGGAIDGLRVEPGTVRPPDETSARSYFFLRVVIEVAESLEDPYAAAF